MVVQQLALLLPIIEDLEKQHPAELPDACASPSTPTSLRIMSWMDLMVVLILIRLLLVSVWAGSNSQAAGW